MKRMLMICAVAASPALAQDLNFDISGTQSCLGSMGDDGDKRQCIGVSAGNCMETAPGGYSTAGMGGCMDRELTWWDGLLNQNYQRAMQRAKANDAENDGFGESQATSLRDMQRAWIPFRDAKCTFERSQWGGGTGGGPATVSCLMYETAEQAMYLSEMANY